MGVDEYYITIAKAVSERSTCLKKHYGAVIVNNGEICSTGYNGNPRGEPHCSYCSKHGSGKDLLTYCSCKSVHAEMNAIISASRQEMLGSTLYLAGFDVATNKYIAAEPCEICLRLIKNAGIAKVYNKNGLLYHRNAAGLLVKGGINNG